MRGALSRRRLLTMLGASGFAIVPGAATEAASTDGLAVRYGRLRGTWLPVPPDGLRVPWNWVDPLTPDVLGLLDADGEVVTLKRPGLWLVNWTLTFESFGRGNYKCSLAAYRGGRWDSYCDGNEIAASAEAETTLVGACPIVSDGAAQVTLNARHNLKRNVKLSEREYECSLNVAWLRA